MRVGLVVAALAGCWKAAPAPPPPRPAEGPPQVELVAAEGATVQFLASSPRGGIAITRTVEAPASVHALAWLDRELVILSHDDDTGAPHVGLATSKDGYRPLKLPDDKAWPDLQQPGQDHFDPLYTITPTVANELWLGRCEWGWMGDGRECTEWAWARLVPAEPTPILTRGPVERPPLYELVAAPPPSTLKVELVADARPPESEDDARYPILRCTRDGVTTEFPAEDDRDTGFLGMADLRWLSTDPAMFRVARKEMCMDVCTIEKIFEGCEPSKRWEDARVVPGPEATHALIIDERVSIRWRGKEIGAHREKATHVTFAPPKERAKAKP